MTSPANVPLVHLQDPEDDEEAACHHPYARRLSTDAMLVSCKRCARILAKQVEGFLTRPIKNCPWCGGAGKAYQWDSDDKGVCFYCQGGEVAE